MQYAKIQNKTKLEKHRFIFLTCIFTLILSNPSISKDIDDKSLLLNYTNNTDPFNIRVPVYNRRIIELYRCQCSAGNCTVVSLCYTVSDSTNILLYHIEYTKVRLLGTHFKGTYGYKELSFIPKITSKELVHCTFKRNSGYKKHNLFSWSR